MQRLRRGSQSNLMLRRGWVYLIRTIRLKSLFAVTSPDFWLRSDSAQEQDLGRRPPADKYHARTSANDFRNQFRDLWIRKGSLTVWGKRRKCSVIVKQKYTRGRRLEAHEKFGADVVM